MYDLERTINRKGSPHETLDWCIKGTHMLHHPSEPARQWRDGRGWLWFWINRIHRWDGPAQYKNGEYQYWIMGKKLTKDQWESDPRRIQWLGEQAMGI